MAFVKMATTLVTAVSAAQAAAVFKHATDRGPTVVVTTMAATLSLLHWQLQCTKMTGLVPIAVITKLVAL
jgi:hypothetical protein